MIEQSTDENTQKSLEQSVSALKRQKRKATACEAKFQDHEVYSRQTYSKDPSTLLGKKGKLYHASELIKKIKSTLIESVKIRSELEKILAEHGSSDLGEIKLNEWITFSDDMDKQIQKKKQEVKTLIGSSSDYLK